MVVPVVILQTNPVALQTSERCLTQAGFEWGVQFVAEFIPDAVGRHIKSGERQLLITGTIRGDIESTVKFMEGAKRANPRVVVALFSVYPSTEGPHDLVIRKDGGYPELIEAVRKFLSAGIN
ncbi:MAG: hypothetical protein WC802_03705 [Patescibacteria group bacterium]|jgi:hypothetical protein